MSFGGIRAAQILSDYWLWEALLNAREAKGIVELGTFCGGFSHFLAAQAKIRGYFFRTYDVVEPERQIPGFVRADIFAHSKDIGEWLSVREPLFLFCDGGNKARELKTFSQYLTSVSTILVHDWQTEFLPKDIPDNVEPIYEALCDKIGSITRVFQVKDA